MEAGFVIKARLLCLMSRARRNAECRDRTWQKMAKFFPLENACYLSGWFLLHVLLLYRLRDLLSMPHLLGK